MITLPEQIQSVVIHLAAGWLFGFFAHFHNSLWILAKGKKRKILVDLCGMVLFVCLLFYTMFQINGGQTHPYLLAILLIGLIIYEFIYDPVFMPFFRLTERIVKTVFIRFSLAFSPLFSIINILGKKVKGGKKHGKSTDKSNRPETASEK